MENKIVGEGTYGCVVEPALECKKPENYENKVSKVMWKKDALEELKEYELLKSIPDIDKYTVNVPVLSNNTTLSVLARMSASPLRMTRPSFAAVPTALTRLMGTASPNAQGQAIIKTESAVLIAKLNSAPNSNHQANPVVRLVNKTPGTKYCVMVSMCCATAGLAF